MYFNFAIEVASQEFSFVNLSKVNKLDRFFLNTRKINGQTVWLFGTCTKDLDKFASHRRRDFCSSIVLKLEVRLT